MKSRSKRTLLLLLSLCCVPLCAQTLEEIQQSSDYLWGLGHGNSLRKADNEALAALVSQISTQVSANFEQITSGKQEGEKAEAEETFKSVINTYSKATLNNTRRIVIQNEPQAAVLRYIKLTEIERIFEGRRKKLLNYAAEAIEVEKKNRVADALRYYYWALVLLQSYPDGNYLTMKDDNGQDQLLATWIPKQMHEIFKNLTLTVEGSTVEDNLKTLNLKVLYKGNPAENYDYTYFDGRDWSNVFSAKDGRGIIELPVAAGETPLQLRTEYAFEGESNIDSELAEVMETITPISLRNAYVQLNVTKVKQEKPQTATLAVLQGEEKNAGMQFLTAGATSPYMATMKKVEQAIRRKEYAGVEALCTPKGWEMFNRLIKFGNARIVRQPQYRFLEQGDEVSCRSLPMSFSFQGNRRTFVEDVVFVLNKEGKVESLSFALNKPAVDDIIHRTTWGDTVRSVLINFLESYKTAYALKRYDYINSIFSDDALIITGSVLKSVSTVGERQPLDKEVVKYTRQTKQEFMKKLSHIFKSNEFVNLRFADNQVRKSGVGGEIYGIQIKQDYFSSTYGDTGYLFLMVDLNNPKEPVIHVRTWQPEKDPDFGLIDLSHF